MPDLLTQEDDEKSSENRESGDHGERLSELLTNLKANPGNPDLWMEAATVYLALGRRRQASKAYRASIETVDERKGEDAALARIHRFLYGEDTPSAEPSEEPGSEPSRGGEAPGPVGPETLSPPGPPASTAERVPTPTSEGDALKELRRDLSPPQTVTCPHCNTLLAVTEQSCPGCGEEVRERGATLEERVGQARSALEENRDDPDAMFTMAAHLAVSGQHEEALKYLIRLTALDPRYPGLWWVKARVFLAAGKEEAAEASLRTANEIMTGSR